MAAWSSERTRRVDEFLVGRFAHTRPDSLQKALRYPIESGGKRVRPLLTFAAHEALGGEEIPAVLPAAAALELVHTYSLVHDDLPCMDDDDERRGRPTLHKVFGEAAGVLVGDALLTEAFVVLAETGPLAASLVRELGEAAGHLGMVGGQAEDIGLGGPIATIEALEGLHRKKTGALIRCAVRLGAIVGGASEAQLRALTAFGDAVGLAFQLADDVLDEAEVADGGVPSFVAFLGREETMRRAQRLVAEALEAIGRLPEPGALEALARFTVERSH